MLTRIYALTGILVLLGHAVTAQERVTLTAPETKPNNTGYRVERITEQFDDPATAAVDETVLVIQLLGDNGEAVSCVYNALTNPTAKTLSEGQNKANFSTAYAANATTGSRKQRIFHRLVIMNEAVTVCGKSLTGSLSGSVP